MSHAVENMFSVRITPWHNLGNVIKTGVKDLEQGLELAGLNWSADKQPIYLANGQQIDTHCAVVRSSDKSVLGVVGKGYEVFQNASAWKWFQPFLDSGLVEMTTAGSLYNGRTVWMLAEIKGNLTVLPGDEIKKFLLLSNTHDGSKRIRVGFTPIRVVCANTLGMAHRADNLFRVSHTANVYSSMAAVREVIDVVNADYKATEQQFQFLAKRKITTQQMRQFFTMILAANPIEPTNKETNAIDECIAYAINGRGQTGERTVWAAYNGLTEYLSYSKPAATTENRLNNLWFGDGEKLLDRALAMAMDLAV